MERGGGKIRQEKSEEERREKERGGDKWRRIPKGKDS